MLEQVVIPETLTLVEREPILKTIVEYVHRIIPSKLFRYRECSEMQLEAFYHDNIYMLLLLINSTILMIVCCDLIRSLSLTQYIRVHQKNTSFNCVII